MPVAHCATPSPQSGQGFPASMTHPLSLVRRVSAGIHCLAVSGKERREPSRSTARRCAAGPRRTAGYWYWVKMGMYAKRSCREKALKAGAADQGARNVPSSFIITGQRWELRSATRYMMSDRGAADSASANARENRHADSIPRASFYDTESDHAFHSGKD